MPRPQAITDHTSLFKRRSWAGRTDGRSNADPLVEIDSMTTTEKRLLAAFKCALGDHQTHKLSTLLLQNDLKALLAELKLPHTKVRHILKNVPKEIMYFEDVKSGHTLLALKQASTSNESNSQASSSRGNGRTPSVSVGPTVSRSSVGPSTSANPEVSRRVRAASSSSSHGNATSVSDSDSEGAATYSKPSKSKTDSEGRRSESTWNMQKPTEHQQHTKEIVSASVSPPKKRDVRRFGPRQSAPVASTSSSTFREANNANGRQVGEESDSEQELARVIRQSMSVAPASRSDQQASLAPVRKQPAPPTIAALRETAAEHGIPLQEERNSLFRQASPANDYEDTTVPLHARETRQVAKTPSRSSNGDLEEQYGIEIPIDEVSSRRLAHNMDDDDKEDEFDLDMDVSHSGKSHHRTSSGGGSARKEMPDLLFDGYKATRSRGRSVRPGPPGMDETSTRDSSVQDAESIEEHDPDEDKPEVDKLVTSKRGGPTKPGRRHVSDDSSSDDVIEVTSVRVGAPPAKSQEDRDAEREQRRRERKEKEARREARRLERERLSKRKNRNPLPTFRNTQGQEAAELKLAYEAYLKDLQKAKRTAGSSFQDVIDLEAEETLPDLATIAEENASWTQHFSYESHKNRGNRPDYNTVKFWPYNLPFPDRRKNEAIVAVAGGCVVRVFRLSEERGVTELWNAVDESINWEEESWHEVFYTCAWTHDVRRDASIAPQWRKWPILCVAGRSKETKILDGYSGTTLKVIQGHGGSINSLAVHPSLPHVIATASTDESISLWDISVPVAKPEVEAGYGSLDEIDKRRKGYAEGERLCVFGGYAGHVEAILSISIHPSMPLLVSGGGDCKLRIWRIPDSLPLHPTSSLTHPIPIDPPEKSARPPSFAFPVFTQASLHSHHIDHVEWIGHRGHLLTRSLCFNAPGKRVMRLFRPKFFDTISELVTKPPPAAKPADVVGFGVDFPSHVEMLARWTTPSCSGGIGDGVVCTANELYRDVDGKLGSRKRVYIPSIEPAVHIYDLDLKEKQADLDQLLQEYPFKLGREMLFEEDKRKNNALKAADCQTAGLGWLVGVGEGEKIVVWKRKQTTERKKAISGMRKLLRGLNLLDELDKQSDMDTQAIESPSSSREGERSLNADSNHADVPAERENSLPQLAQHSSPIEELQPDKLSAQDLLTKPTSTMRPTPFMTNGVGHSPSPHESEVLPNGVADISTILRVEQQDTNLVDMDPQTVADDTAMQVDGYTAAYSDRAHHPERGIPRSPSVEYV